MVSVYSLNWTIGLCTVGILELDYRSLCTVKSHTILDPRRSASVGNLLNENENAHMRMSYSARN
jgi:hypothetical protein